MGFGRGSGRASSSWVVGLLACVALSCDELRLNRPVVALTASEPGLDFGVVAVGEDEPRELRLINSGRAAVAVSLFFAPAPFEVRGFPAEGVSLAAGPFRATGTSGF
jgi:hypothetical protein